VLCPRQGLLQAASASVMMTLCPHEHLDAVSAAAVRADVGVSLYGRRNTEAWQLAPDLGNQPDDLYIKDKNTYDSFQNTQLESMLQERGIDTVIVGGLATNMCCGATARCAAAACDQHVLRCRCKRL